MAGRYASMSWRHIHLITQLTKREVMGRYRGSILGMVWSFLYPLLMLSVYYFVFGFVLKVKWGVKVETGDVPYGVVLFAGLIVHMFFSECLVRSPSVVRANTQFVKKVVFPIEVLSIVVVCTSLFHFLIGLLILLVFNVLIVGTFYWTIICVPIVLFPLVLLSVGLSWLLASVGVFVRDIGQIVGILSTVLLFLSGILFPIDMVPEHLRMLLYLNPLTLIVEQLRAVVIYGQAPDWGALAVYGVVAVLVVVGGYRWFQRTRTEFADVL